MQRILLLVLLSGLRRIPPSISCVWRHWRGPSHNAVKAFGSRILGCSHSLGKLSARCYIADVRRGGEGEATRFGDIASLLISGYEPTIPSVYMCVCISALNLYPLYSAMMASTRSKMSSSMEVLTKRILHSSEVTHRSNTVHPGSRLPRFRIFATSLQASKIVKRCTPLIDFDFQCRHIAI